MRFSRRGASREASRWAGDGERGAGFVVYATASGMVGMLHGDMTGSAEVERIHYQK